MGERIRDAVAEVLPRLRDRADGADRAAAVPRASLDELTAAGAFRMLAPVRHGGTESGLVEFLEVVRDVSASCGSTGWLAGWFGAHLWHLALFPAEAQRDVWGADPDALVAAAYAATGNVVEVAGGYRLQGRWSWATGCEHAGWVLLGGMLTAPDGGPTDLAAFLVPAGELRIERNWDTVGLRAAAAHDLLAEDVFVPARRALSFAPCLEGAAPGRAANPGVLYRLPLPSVFAAVVAASVIGMAEGAYASQVGWLRTRLGASWSGFSLGTDDFSNARLAAAGADVDASWLQVVRDVRELVRAAGTAGAAVPMELRRRIRRDQVVATRRAAAAVDHLFEHSGGEVVRLGNPVEQAWRNIHTTQAHALNDLDRTLAMYGAGELAVDVHPPMV